MTRQMKELVEVQGGFKPSVELPDHFYNEEVNRHFAEGYLVTPDTLEVFWDVRNSLQPKARTRARLFTGTFGTGKSDLMLMIANYITRSADDPILQPFFQRLRRLDQAKGDLIYQARAARPPYLLVLLQGADATTFRSFVMNGLIAALERAGLRHLLGRTSYEAALEAIQRWRRDYPDNIQRLERHLATDHGMRLEQLEQALRGQGADRALERFRDLHSLAAGASFSEANEIDKPHEAYKEVAKGIVKEGYSGIFVIADEFTHLLHQLAQGYEAPDVKAIDTLATAASDSQENQLHFYIVGLESFASAKGTDRQSKLALERTGGRFLEGMHELQSQYTEELISASIGKLVRPSELLASVSAQADALLTVAMELWKDRDDPRITRPWLQETVVQGCFPLHPLTTYCLPRLNNVLAQNERTMFRFIQDDEKGLRHFIQHSPAEPNEYGWIPLLSLDRLFPYFEPTLKDKREDLWQAYLDARSRLTAHELEHGMEGRVLRVLVLLEVMGDTLRVSPERLADALSLPRHNMDPLLGALHRLEEEAEILYRTMAGSYHIRRPGQVSRSEIRRAVEKRAQDMTLSLASELNRLYSRPAIKATEYNNHLKSHRALTAYFATPAELESPATLEAWRQGKDGLVIYIVASSQREVDEARTLALRRSREATEVVIAIPPTPSLLASHLRLRLALERIQREASSTSEDVHKIHSDLMKDYSSALNDALARYDKPQELEWYVEGGVRAINTATERSKISSEVMTKRFPYTPMHGLTQHLEPDKFSLGLKRAIAEILKAPFKLSTKTAAHAVVLLEGAKALGLIYELQAEGSHVEYDVREPTREDSRRIWALMESKLKEGRPWAEVQATLLAPPYGLYPSLLSLFVAAFYRLYRDSLTVLQRTKAGLQQVEPVSEESIKSLLDKPADFQMIFEPLAPWEHALLTRVEQALPGQLAHRRGGSLRTLVGHACRTWAIKGLPALAREVTDADLAMLLPDLTPELRTLALNFRDLASHASPEQVATALLTDLPRLLALPDDPNEWDEAMLTQSMALLRQACRVLQELPQELQGYLAEKIARLFGADAPPIQRDDALRQALAWRNGTAQVRLQRIAEGGELLYHLRNSPIDFDQLFLNTLPHRWGYGVMSTWDSIETITAYLEQVARSIQAVERLAASTPVPAPPTPPKPPQVVSPATPHTSAGPTTPATFHTTVPTIPSGGDALGEGSSRHLREQRPDPENEDLKVQRAFDEISQKMFDRLNPTQQRVLLALLNQRYGQG